jgi:hypothetical protein
MIEWPGKMIENEEFRVVLAAIFEFDPPFAAEIYEGIKTSADQELAKACLLFRMGSAGLFLYLGPDRAAGLAQRLLQEAGIVKTNHKRGKNKLPPSDDKDARRKRLQYERKQHAAQLVKVGKFLEEHFMKHPDATVREFVRQQIGEVTGRKGD